MGKISDAAKRIKAAHGQGGATTRDAAIEQELTEALKVLENETIAHQLKQADMWLSALRFRLNQIGVPWSLAQSNDFFVGMFGNAARQVVAEHEASAAEWARELAAAGLTVDEVFERATAVLEDEVRGSQSAPWN